MDTPSPSKSLGLSVAIIVGGLVIASAVFLSRATPSIQPTQLRATLPLATPEHVVVTVEANDRVLGLASAPVTVVMFSDFECPYCQQWHQTTLPQLRRDYLDTGKARLVFKDFPLSQLHPNAQLAAEAAQCAHQQEKFWEYAEKLTGKTGELTPTMVHQFAEQLGLDLARFDGCVANHEQAEVITRNVQAGIEAGVTGTPTFVINGQLLEGAQSIEVLRQAIEAPAS